MQFSAGETEGTLTLQEPVGKHFTATANAGERICETPVTVTTVDTVRTPPPATFPWKVSCTAEMMVQRPMLLTFVGAFSSGVCAATAQQCKL